MTEYILKVSDQIIDERESLDIQVSCDADVGPKADIPAADLEEQFIKAALVEMAQYLSERFDELSLEGNLSDYYTPENVDQIYITQHHCEPVQVIVELTELPEGWWMEEPDLREFYWRPLPAHSQEETGAYFQPRKVSGVQ